MNVSKTKTLTKMSTSFALSGRAENVRLRISAGIGVNEGSIDFATKLNAQTPYAPSTVVGRVGAIKIGYEQTSGLEITIHSTILEDLYPLLGKTDNFTLFFCFVLSLESTASCDAESTVLGCVSWL